MPDDPAVVRLTALATALEAVAQATASANPDALAACEEPLASALARTPAPGELSASDPHTVRELVRRVATALFRCRTVGRATTELIMTSLSAQGVAPGYLPAGLGAPAPRLGRLEVRV